MVGHQLLDRLERLGLAVLDDVALVQDAVAPLDAAEEGDVLADDIVRRHYEVVLTDLGTVTQRYYTVHTQTGIAFN